MIETSFPVHHYKNSLVASLAESKENRRALLMENPNLGIVFIKPFKFITRSVVDSLQSSVKPLRQKEEINEYRSENLRLVSDGANIRTLIEFLASMGMKLRDIEEKDLSWETAKQFYPEVFFQISPTALKFKQHLLSGVWRMLVVERTYTSSASFLTELNILKGSITSENGDPLVDLATTSLRQSKSIRPLRSILGDRTKLGDYPYDELADGLEIRNSAIHVPDDLQELEYDMALWDSACTRII